LYNDWTFPPHDSCGEGEGTQAAGKALFVAGVPSLAAPWHSDARFYHCLEHRDRDKPAAMK